MKKKKIVVLTGAGISAESGVKTFRDADGLWEGHDIEQVATPYGFNKNPERVLNFYNGLRKQLKHNSSLIIHNSTFITQLFKNTDSRTAYSWALAVITSAWRPG